MPTVHELKTVPESFEPIEAGIKLFEIRLNDRDYQVNDILILKEWLPDQEEYTGRAVIAGVAFILTDSEWGLKPDYIAMSIKIMAVEV